jgi:hypothetical protein
MKIRHRYSREPRATQRRNRYAVLPDGSALVYLTQGQAALVDAADLVLVLVYRWHYNHGYAVTGTQGGPLGMHQLLLDCQVVDHRNLNRLDNRRANLRRATWSGNAAHRPKSPRARVSQYKGVFLNRQRGRWFARVTKDGRRYYGGWSTSEETAARWYNQKALELFGDFAHLNDLGLQ